MSNSVPNVASACAESIDLDASVEPTLLRDLSEDQKARLTDLLDQYLCCLENGESIDAEELAAKNPDLADVFNIYLSKLNAMYGIAVGFQDKFSAEISGSESLPEVINGSMNLGDFTILREIGRGGMGVVYEAQQNSLNRKVAIKLLPMASLLDGRQIARFKNEARAAGLLQHPNIVPVHSVGSERGIHYYSMQLIEGISVDAWVKQQLDSVSDVASADRSQSAAARIQCVIKWGIEVAEALQCAHESGIVHRDIKPSNLLLDVCGKIWITDFGLARCQNDLSLTMSGDVLGTMRYMSPEQASGRAAAVDHRTDIYSLAATLFEMLALRTAIVGDDGPTLLSVIQEEDPPRLSTCLPASPSDLGVVLQMAMAKRKDDRYESAQDFAADLCAVLEGRPTHAKPPSVAALTSRWMVRHRRSVAAGVSVLAVAIVWLATSNVIIRQKIREAEFSGLRSDLYRQQAYSTVDVLGTRVAEQLATVPGAEHIRQSLLNETLAYYEEFAASAAGDPKLEADLALTHSRIATLVREMRSSIEAIPHFERAAELYAHLDWETSETTKRHAAQNFNQLGLALADAGQKQEAFDNFQLALELQRELVGQNGGDARYASELALTKNNLGLLLSGMGRTKQARTLFDDTIVLLRTKVEQDPKDELAVRGLTAALANLSAITIQSSPEQAIELLQQALQHRLNASANSSNRLRASSEIATLYNNLGSAYVRSHQLSPAEAAYNSAIRLQRQVHAIAPKVAQYARDLATSLNNLAMIQQQLKNHPAAVESAREAIELQRASMQASESDADARSRLGAMQHNLATSLLAMKELPSAEAEFRAAIASQHAALSVNASLAEAKTFLLEHYSSLLRSQALGRHWRDAEATSLAYLEAAESDAAAVSRVESDLAEVARLRAAGKIAAGVKP